MQTQPPNGPAAYESARHGTTTRAPEPGRISPAITITPDARNRILELRGKLGLPVKGIRVKAIPRSQMRAEFALSFVPAEEAESPTDAIQSLDDIDLYISADSVPYLDGAIIDYVVRIIGSELTVAAPIRKLDTSEGHIAAKVQKVLAEAVNPSLAAHGGSAVLIDFQDGVVSLELTGGCQGCSMAASTMKQGIETSILQAVPEVQRIRDVTNHAIGITPYFKDSNEEVAQAGRG